ncbi:MAG: homoserine O-succinyltransferase MetA [Steroidobacteraceae bacterium]
MPLTILPRPSTAPNVRGAAEPCRAADHLTIALVNNMPDSALESTAAQFSRLLRAASGSLPVQLRFCYTPEVPRGADALDHVTRVYWPIDALWQQPIDGLIVTGTEPKAARLDDEPYWCRLQQLLEWASAQTFSSIWSCLAAHAAVQLLDGVERQRLDQKRFGVFEHRLAGAHPLLDGVRAPMFTPHSRWNELPVSALRACRYTIVSASVDTGADLFVKSAGSLLVFFQGHPEYDETTLLKEFRRDVGRFVRGERPDYPALPRGYLSERAAAILDEFRERTLANPSADLLATFPMDSAARCLQNTWSAAAARIYSNWLALIAAAKWPQGMALASRV